MSARIMLTACATTLAASLILAAGAPAGTQPAWVGWQQLSPSPGVAYFGTTPGGLSLAVWTDGSTGALYASTRMPGAAGWARPSLVGPTDGKGNAAVALGADGRAIAAWTAKDSSQMTQVYTAAFSPTTGWHPYQAVGAHTTGIDNVSVAVNQSGVALLIWRDAAVPATPNFGASPDGGLSWTTGPGPTAPGKAVAETAVAVDSAGNRWAIWSTTANPTGMPATRHTTIYAASAPAGHLIFSAPQSISNGSADATLSTSQLFGHSQATIDADGHGNLLVAFSDAGAGTGNRLLVAEKALAAPGWPAPAALSGQCDVLPNTAVLSDQAGDATVLATCSSKSGVLYADKPASSSGWTHLAAIDSLQAPASGYGTGFAAAESPGGAVTLAEQFLSIAGPRPPLAYRRQGHGAWIRASDPATGTQELVAGAGEDSAGNGLLGFGGFGTPAAAAVLDVTPPVVSVHASRLTAFVGQPVTFTGTATAGFTPVGVIGWSFSDGQGTGRASVSHGFSRPGRYTASFTAANQSGARATGSLRITVTLKPPCLGASGVKLKRCRAKLSYTRALSKCLSIRRKSKRAKCVAAAGAAYRRALKLIACDQIGNKRARRRCRANLPSADPTGPTVSRSL